MPAQNTTYSSTGPVARDDYTHHPWLKTALSAFGWGQIIFFTPALIVLLFDLPQPRAIEVLVRWGPGGADQYEEMIAMIYIIWGYFCIKASHSPFKHELFLDFTLYGNTAHFSLMTVMAVVNQGDRIHLLGDVLAAWIAFAPFAYTWNQAKASIKEFST